MKRLTTLFFSLAALISFNSFSSTSLSVQNPDFWYGQNGTMDKISLQLTPAGLYTQCDLFIDFSGEEYYNNNYYGTDEDSIEVQYYFELPSKAIVTDSWLWVGDDIVFADLIDRSTATQIYEDIVDRRKDPSILYKNSNTQYELRVYPLTKDEPRKVKISFLIQNSWSASGVTTTIPLGFLDFYNTKETPLTIVAIQDSNWTNPVFSGSHNVTEDIINGKSIIKTIIPATEFDNRITLSYNTPLNNGVFLQKHPSNNNSGFYQLAILPSHFIQSTKNRNVVILFDHDPAKTQESAQSIWDQTFDALKQTLSDGDYFNIVYSKLSTKTASDNWIKASDSNIDSVQIDLWKKSPLSSHSSVPSMIGESFDFIDNNGGSGDILLISSSAGINSKNSADILLKDINDIGNDYLISVVDYFNSYTPSAYINGVRYYGNAYLYSELARTTGGIYSFTRGGENFSLLVNRAITAGEGSYSVFNASIDLDNFGFTYSNYQLSNPNRLYLNECFRQVGKYYLNSDFEITLVAETEEGIRGGTSVADNPYHDADSVTLQIWADQRIRTLENQGSSTDQIGNIIELSLDSRILSRQTAFLALDPNDFDDVVICENCEDIILAGNNEVLSDESILSLSVFPNPITDMMNITIELPEGYADLKGSLTLTSLEGITLYSLDIDGAVSEQLLKLNLADLQLDLETGTYLLTIHLGDFIKTIQVVKA